MVTKLDRLGRSLEHLIGLARDLQEQGVDLVVLDQGIDTSTAVGRMFFQILGAIAEHALMSERAMDGLAARPRPGPDRRAETQITPRQARIAQEMYDETGEDGRPRYTVADIATEFGVAAPPSTVTSPNPRPQRPPLRSRSRPKATLPPDQFGNLIGRSPLGGVAAAEDHVVTEAVVKIIPDAP